MSRSRSNVAGRVDPRIRQRDTPVGWTDRSALGLLPQMGQYQVKPGDKLTGGHGNGAPCASAIDFTMQGQDRRPPYFVAVPDQLGRSG